MLTEDEAEAIAVGVRLLTRTGDPGLQKAADVNDPLRDPRRAQDADHLSGCRRARRGAGNPAHVNPDGPTGRALTTGGSRTP
jgi:hypothetical protein